MKVATYSRISTDEDRQPFSLEAQKDRLKAYISAQDGWTLVRSYTDQVSGKTLDRPGLKQALAEARDRSYELLLVFKVDRLARSTSGLVQVLEGLEAAGVAFRSVSEPFDTSTAAGRMMIQMLGVFAEFEREMIVERTKMGLAKKASKGEWTGGKPPYGYSYDIDRKLLFPVEGEAVLVRQIFDRYANRKWGSARISKWLNEKARTTRGGYPWTPKTVLDLLRNSTYIGKLPFNGEVFEAIHEPIIDLDLFRQTQDLLKIRGEDMPLRAANATPYILTGLLTCSRCGHGFIGTRASGKSAVYRYYTCYCRQRNGSVKCDQDRIPADRLEEAILTVTIDALRDRSIFEEAARKALEAWTGAHPSRGSELRRLDSEIAEKRKAINRYLRAFERGRMPESAAGDRLRELEQEIGALEAEKVVIEAELQKAPTVPGKAELESLRARIRQAVEGSEPELVKELLAGIIDEIVVESRKSITPYFVSPGVLTLAPSRRRTIHNTNPEFPGQGFWLKRLGDAQTSSNPQRASEGNW